MCVVWSGLRKIENPPVKKGIKWGKSPKDAISCCLAESDDCKSSISSESCSFCCSANLSFSVKLSIWDVSTCYKSEDESVNDFNHVLLSYRCILNIIITFCIQYTLQTVLIKWQTQCESSPSKMPAEDHLKKAELFSETQLDLESRDPDSAGNAAVRCIHKLYRNIQFYWQNSCPSYIRQRESIVTVDFLNTKIPGYHHETAKGLLCHTNTDHQCSACLYK